MRALEEIMVNISKVSIVSVIPYEGILTEESLEIEQRLTFNADGRYWLSRYVYYSETDEKQLSEKKQGKFYKGKTEKIIEAFQSFVYQYEIEQMNRDSGEWILTITFDNGNVQTYNSSPVAEGSLLSKLSEMIRIELDMFDLCLFDFKKSYPLYGMGPVPVFEKYLPLLYENTFLWNRFSELCNNEFYEFHDRKGYFAFQRNPECIEIWMQMLDNMGGGIPISFFQAAAFIILSYKYAGNDIDAELERIKDNKR